MCVHDATKPLDLSIAHEALIRIAVRNSPVTEIVTDEIAITQRKSIVDVAIGENVLELVASDAVHAVMEVLGTSSLAGVFGESPVDINVANINRRRFDHKCSFVSI